MPTCPQHITRFFACLILAVALTVIAVVLMPATNAFAGSAPTCQKDAAGLDQLFQGQVGRVVGADYVRPFALPNGNTLLLMQDVFLAASNKPVKNLSKAAFAHNAGVLMDARGCVIRTLSGTRSYIGSSKTQTLSHWFWAMAGGMGVDGKLHVLVAEFRNARRTGATTGAVPVGTWHATIDPVSLVVVSFAPAADAGAGLYGWAVASDAGYTYLYSHCYRQFIEGEMLGHDLSCANTIHLARVPVGQFGAPLEYFSNESWTTDPSAATPLAFPGARTINPVSIQNLNGSFVSVSKEGDWWGTTIMVDTAPTAAGPWTTVAAVTTSAKCAECNTYFASLMPWQQADGSLVVSLSNNAWDMHGVAYPNPSLYRSSFIAISLPSAAA